MVFFFFFFFSFLFTVVEEPDTEDDEEIGHEQEETLFFECCRAKQGFVGVGDVVLYLGQLVCVVLSICKTSTSAMYVTCRGVDTLQMELDNTCKMTCSPSKLKLNPVNSSTKLKSSIEKIKSKAVKSKSFWFKPSNFRNGVTPE